MAPRFWPVVYFVYFSALTWYQLGLFLNSCSSHSFALVAQPTRTCGREEKGEWLAVSASKDEQGRTLMLAPVARGPCGKDAGVLGIVLGSVWMRTCKAISM